MVPVLIILAPPNQHFFRDRAHRSTPIRIELEKNAFVQQVNTHLLSPYRAVGGGAVTLPLSHFFIFRSPDFRTRANSLMQSHAVRAFSVPFRELSIAGVERRRCARRHHGCSCLHPFQPVSRERWATSASSQGDACGDSPAVSRV